MSAEILILDDDSEARGEVASILRDDGFRVMAARSVREALSYLRRALPPPCLILLDLTRVVPVGEEFLAARAADPDAIKIPVALLLPPAESEGLNTAGVVAIIGKPVDSTTLLHMVRAIVRQDLSL